LALVTTLAASTLAFAACGDDDDKDDDNDPDVVTDAGDAGMTDTDMTDTDMTDTDMTDTDSPDVEEEVTESNTLVDVAAADGRFGTLLTAVEAAGLAGLVSTSELTVFAPTDDAFAALPEGTLDGLLADTDALTGVLAQHVLNGTVLSSDIAAGESLVTTFAGTKVLVVNAEGTITVGGATVTEADITADNGVIHVLGSVILPGSTIVDVAANAEDDVFSTLTGALTAASLASTLAGEGPFTVFAPTNSAFEALPEGALDALVADLDQLATVLLYHVIPDANIASADIAEGETTLTTAAGIDVTIVNAEGTITVGGSAVVTPDIAASNGVIHVVENVILPPAAGTNTIVDVIAGDDRFSTLVSLAGSVDGLVDLLGTDGPFTLFAPTNAAFELVPQETLDALAADTELLGNLLRYHAVAGSALDAGAVTTSTIIEMANGVYAAVADNDGTFSIAGAVISETDLAADNGVVHVLDNVMTIPGNIAELASGNADLSTLVTVLGDAGLVDTVANGGPFTVFAPTNDAFGDIAGIVELLDVGVVTNVVLSHVASGQFTAADVLGLTELTMVSGATLDIAIVEGVPTIGGVAIAATDIPASNGIVHVLSDVIVPADIAGVATNAGVFSTLLAALGAADLAAAVSLPNGPLTVFAPTDAAFDELPAGTVDALLADIPALTAILTYHVVPGQFDSAAVLEASLLPTLNGTLLKVDADALTVGGAPLNTERLDVFAANGLVHVIDRVILPPGDIPTVATDAGVFSTLLTALTAADLAAALAGEGPFTVFAPTDTAFQPLVDDGTVDALLGDIPALTNILLYHVYDAGAVDAATAISLAGTSITMMNGAEAALALDGENLTIAGAVISATDIPASNGIIHIIDSVILPPAP
jgi:uncharacterized surface protein with fasciclin (FAS1) repeats